MSNFALTSLAHGALVSPDRDFKTSGCTVVLHEVVGEDSWHDVFDLSDRSNSFGAVASSTAVVDSHGVLGGFAVRDDLGSGLCNRHKFYLIIII